MTWNIMFFINSILLGVGLAMDAFSVSLANGLAEPEMRKGRMSVIAGTFALFQALMPMVGWACINFLLDIFEKFEVFIPWCALILLLYIGGKMLIEALRNIFSDEDEDGEDSESGKKSSAAEKLTVSMLILQGIATSIDALSVGFTIADYGVIMALVCAIIIAIVTFVICMVGLKLGKTFGVKLADKAGVLGGCILIFIGLEIFVTGVF